MAASTNRPYAKFSKRSRLIFSKRPRMRVSRVACACVLVILLMLAGPWISGGFAVQPVAGVHSVHAQGRVDLKVPCFNQYEAGLPNGCEASALTNVLNYYGFDLGPTDLVDYWIPQSSTDWIYSYLGDPHDDGGHFIAAPGLVESANDFLAANDSPLRAQELTDASLDDLLEYLKKDVPVIIYVTIDLQPMGEVNLRDPSGYFVPVNSHTVVLKGYDAARGEAYLSDSIAGYGTCDIDWLSHIYEECGSRAVVVG